MIYNYFIPPAPRKLIQLQERIFNLCCGLTNYCGALRIIKVGRLRWETQEGKELKRSLLLRFLLSFQEIPLTPFLYFINSEKRGQLTFKIQHRYSKHLPKILLYRDTSKTGTGSESTFCSKSVRTEKDTLAGAGAAGG